MMKRKKGELSFGVVLTAVIVVALILVIFFVVVLPIAKNGVTLKDIQQNIKEGKILEMFSKNPAASTTFAGDVYVCNPATAHKIFVDGKEFHIKLVKCGGNSAVIDLYDSNKQPLNEQITVAKETTGCFAKSKICIKLFSIDTSGKIPVATLSAKSISDSFEQFTLIQGQTKDFWCGAKKFRIQLTDYKTFLQNHALFTLQIIDVNGNPGYFSQDAHGCIDIASGIDSGYDRRNSGAFKCIDGGLVVCGNLKIFCKLDKDNKKVTIAQCSS